VGDTTSPAVERRRLAKELRSLRTGANRTIYEVAELLECSPGKISRIENGIVGAQLRDVRDLLDIYDVQGRRREDLLDLVRGARRRAWWHDFTDVVPPASARFYGLEAGAATIDSYSGTALLPGLLQTVAYAHALIDTANAPYQVVARRLELRAKRKQVLTSAEPPRVCFVISESALMAKVGGHQVLVDQLRHLTEIAALPNVTIQVMRLDTDAHAAMGTSFTSFGFADDADTQIIYLEQLTGNTYIENAEDVGVYTAAFLEARKLAMDPDDSRRLIAQRSGSVW
jgi:transcriptional regulator with XRE-family HTH domain